MLLRTRERACPSAIAALRRSGKPLGRGVTARPVSARGPGTRTARTSANTASRAGASRRGSRASRGERRGSVSPSPPAPCPWSPCTMQHERDREQRRSTRVDDVGRPTGSSPPGVGKLAVIAQLAIHCAEAATPRAAARILFGNISPRKTQTTTPQDRAKKSTKTWAATSATVPCGRRERVAAGGRRTPRPPGRGRRPCRRSR